MLDRLPRMVVSAAARWLAAATVMAVGAVCVASGQTTPARAAMRPGVGYYSEVQAARGRRVFERDCAQCHGPERSLVTGFRAIANKRHNNRPIYPSVYYYWRRMESEPGDNVDRVSRADKLDATAYLLQQNGFPPGPSELVDDPVSMKGMYLDPGPGFEWLFNGKDLSGWGFLSGAGCEPEPEGCGKTNPWPELRVDGGEMVAAGKMHSLIYTQRKFRNYTFQMEQRFDRPWDDAPELFNANAGVLVFMSDVRLWPRRYTLVDGRWFDFMSVNSVGMKVKFSYDDDTRRRAIRLPNDWQHIEIVARNGGVKAYLNGELVTSIPEGELPEPSRLGFQSQVIPTRWRHIRIRVDD